MTAREHEARVREHYLPLLQRYGATFRAADWGSADGQAARFRVLLEVGDVSEAAILDVGCGVGHLTGHLAARGYRGQYLGIDVLAEMVASARQRCPGWQFRQIDILDAAPDLRSDYVLGSGLFTFADEPLMRATIRAMFAACERGMAFNALSTWADRREPGEFHGDPAATLEFCRALTPRVVLRHDYFRHDFTIYMYRDGVR